MKNHILILLALILFLGCAKEKESNLFISGNILDLKRGKLFLQKIKDDTLLINLDSVKIEGDAHFEFQTYIESPQILLLYLDKKDGQKNDDIIQFFAEKGEMNIRTRLEDFSEDAVIKGSKNQEKLEEFQTMIEKFDERNLDLIQKNYAANESNNQDVLLEIQKSYDRLTRAKYLYTVNYAINHKHMEIAPYLAIAEVYDANIKLLDTIYNSLPRDIKKSLYGKSLKTLLKERRKLEKLNEKVRKQ